MFPLFIMLILTALGVATVYAVFLIYLNKNSKTEEERYFELNKDRIRKAGGEARIDKVRLVSINYEGKIRVKGTGYEVHSECYSKSLCEFDVKLQAVERGLDVVLKVDRVKNGDKWSISGTAYKKN